MNRLHKIITVANALQLEDPIFVDMRSPSEFQIGSIKGAVNIPLFSNEERVLVGTTYKSVGAEDAKQQGLEIVSGKLPAIVQQIRTISQKGSTVVVYCWRGGMRSRSVVGILDIMGIAAYQLLGGYKAYRRHILDKLGAFSLNPQVVVLCGSTGTGKTAVLELLGSKGIPVINLEKLANHRGSVFGQIGLGSATTAPNFDVALLDELERYNDRPFIVVECESKRVGKVYLPDFLYDAIKQGKKLLLITDIETRISRLMEEYLDTYDKNQPEILACIETLRKRLGNKKTERLLDDFRQGHVREVVRTLLVKYYDPLYGYEGAAASYFDQTIFADDLHNAAEKIIEYLNQLGGTCYADSRGNIEK
ncbi:MAG TPA: tRNA 2-selenouridine(34) synthase MnmH [Methylomusa anaerophila]|uniref:tRNA 2-selenouridine(34) synthase MnmH n=1 Tax=Methylomusa anaerophila TaxID=1930071 RepID=UPI0022B2A92A|nr:tRNA 2-selenouridine(34) synthase MnmH [Methylomusa anaerophila]HML87052.1 tRNA 2-selenouridine(34) synthase MnmH [Methylomusa anaerophila]